MDDATARILLNQASILGALAEITIRIPGMDQSVCDGLWRDAAATRKHLKEVADARARLQRDLRVTRAAQGTT